MGLDDIMSGYPIKIDVAHHEAHAGKHYSLTYSVADIGALTTPDDTITLSWKTPKTEAQMHLIFEAICSAGALVRFIEGKTGGGATPTGTLTPYNNRRDSLNVSGILAVDGTTVNKVSYDATVFTGGTELISAGGEYLTGTTLGANRASGASRGDVEWILKKDTFYQLSVKLAGAVPATLRMGWYMMITKTSYL